jgi:ATP-dependent helicase/nuclease subunit A
MLQPSHLMEEVEPAFSPTESLGLAEDEIGMSAAERGTLMHRLLHLLSVVAPARRHALALEYLERFRFKLSPEKRDAMVQNLLLLMSDPIYAPIFSPQALSEVSVSGLLENAAPITGAAETLALSGQIDRLLVTPERVLIVDFKTGELPAFGRRGYEIPELYRRQMEAYRQLLQQIYPEREVECALIYTAVPILLPVPATLTPRHAIAI